MASNKLLKKVKEFERKNKINQKLDQNFLINEEIINDFIEFCHIKRNEKIIEVGSGLGFLTEKISFLANKVFSFEIDERFKEFLTKLPNNTKIIFGDAYKLFCNKDFIFNLGKIDKIIGNFPYSKIENFLHPLMKGGWFEGDIFMIGPASFVNTINQNAIFNSYYQAFFIKKIDKSNFYPSPKTVSAIIYLKRIEKPEKTKNIFIFIKRFLYEHEDWKLKNCLREAIIKGFYQIKNKFITKNQARQIIKKLKINSLDLEKKVCEIDLRLYDNIIDKIKLLNIEQILQ